MPKTTVQGLLCLDMDNSILNGHMHNTLAKNGVLPGQGAKHVSKILKKTGGFKNLKYNVALIREALKNNVAVAINSFTNYPETMIPILKKMGLKDSEIRKIHFVCGFPSSEPKPKILLKKPMITITTDISDPKANPEHSDRKDQHMALSMANVGLDPNDPEDRKHVLLIDDSPENCRKAQEKGCLVIKVPKTPNPNPSYIQDTQKIINQVSKAETNVSNMMRYISKNFTDPFVQSVIREYFGENNLKQIKPKDINIKYENGSYFIEGKSPDTRKMVKKILSDHEVNYLLSLHSLSNTEAFGQREHAKIDRQKDMYVSSTGREASLVGHKAFVQLQKMRTAFVMGADLGKSTSPLRKAAQDKLDEVRQKRASSAAKRGEMLSNIFISTESDLGKQLGLKYPVMIGESGQMIAIMNREQQKLGKGSFGEVFLGMDIDSGQLVAVKFQIPKNEVHKQWAMEENTVMKGLNRLVDTIEYQKYIVSVDELGWGVDYEDAMKKNRGNDTQAQIKQMNMVIEYLDQIKHVHDSGYLHRDIKPGNMKWDDESNKAKVFDFGMAVRKPEKGKYLDDVQMGTELFQAPQVFEGKYSEETDIFACGVSVLQMISKDFRSDLIALTWPSVVEQYHSSNPRDPNIIRNHFKEVAPDVFGQNVKDDLKPIGKMILRMLDPDVRNVPSLEEAMAVFEARRVQLGGAPRQEAQSPKASPSVGEALPRKAEAPVIPERTQEPRIAPRAQASFSSEQLQNLGHSFQFNYMHLQKFNAGFHGSMTYRIEPQSNDQYKIIGMSMHGHPDLTAVVTGKQLKEISESIQKETQAWQAQQAAQQTTPLAVLQQRAEAAKAQAKVEAQKYQNIKNMSQEDHLNSFIGLLGAINKPKVIADAIHPSRSTLGDNELTTLTVQPTATGYKIHAYDYSLERENQGVNIEISTEKLNALAKLYAMGLGGKEWSIVPPGSVNTNDGSVYLQFPNANAAQHALRSMNMAYGQDARMSSLEGGNFVKVLPNTELFHIISQAVAPPKPEVTQEAVPIQPNVTYETLPYNEEEFKSRISQATTIDELMKVIREYPNEIRSRDGNSTMDKQLMLQNIALLANDSSSIQTISSSEFDPARLTQYQLTSNHGIRDKFLQLISQLHAQSLQTAAQPPREPRIGKIPVIPGNTQEPRKVEIPVLPTNVMSPEVRTVESAFLKSIEKAETIQDLIDVIQAYQSEMKSKTGDTLDKKNMLNNIKLISENPNSVKNIVEYGDRMVFGGSEITSNYGIRDKFIELLEEKHKKDNTMESVKYDEATEALSNVSLRVTYDGVIITPEKIENQRNIILQKLEELRKNPQLNNVEKGKQAAAFINDQADNQYNRAARIAREIIVEQRKEVKVATAPASTKSEKPPLPGVLDAEGKKPVFDRNKAPGKSALSKAQNDPAKKERGVKFNASVDIQNFDFAKGKTEGEEVDESTRRFTTTQAKENAKRKAKLDKLRDQNPDFAPNRAQPIPDAIKVRHQQLSEMLDYARSFLSNHLENKSWMGLKIYDNEAFSSLEISIYKLEGELRKGTLPSEAQLQEFKTALNNCPVSEPDELDIEVGAKSEKEIVDKANAIVDTELKKHVSAQTAPAVTYETLPYNQEEFKSRISQATTIDELMKAIREYPNEIRSRDGNATMDKQLMLDNIAMLANHSGAIQTMSSSGFNPADLTSYQLTSNHGIRDKFLQLISQLNAQSLQTAVQPPQEPRKTEIPVIPKRTQEPRKAEIPVIPVRTDTAAPAVNNPTNPAARRPLPTPGAVTASGATPSAASAPPTRVGRTLPTPPVKSTSTPSGTRPLPVTPGAAAAGASGVSPFRRTIQGTATQGPPLVPPSGNKFKPGGGRNE